MRLQLEGGPGQIPDQSEFARLMGIYNELPIESMCYRLVDIFRGITQRKLWLKDVPEGQPSTNGYLISIPFQDTYAYQYTEHELSHILFESDPFALKLFVDGYVEDVTTVAAQTGCKINARVLRKIIEGIAGILDDERVIFLWERLYAGSGAIMRRMKYMQALPQKNNAHDNVIQLLHMLAGMGYDETPNGALDHFRVPMWMALRRSQMVTFEMVLCNTKWLLAQLVTEVLRMSMEEDPIMLPPLPAHSAEGSNVAIAPEDNTASWENDLFPETASQKIEATVEQRSKALNELVKKSQGVAYDYDVQDSQFKSAAQKQAAHSTAAQARKASLNNTDQLALHRKAQKDTFETLKKTREALRKAIPYEERIRKDAYAKVEIETSAPSNQKNPKEDLSFEDQATVQRLRALFVRVQGRRKMHLEDTGNILDIQAYIQRKRTRESSAPVFQEEQSGQGFTALLLLDQSSSMRGPKTVQARRACRIISEALDFPFVTQHIWGFRSNKHGVVNIQKFSPQSTFSTNFRKLNTTPLHTAIRLAANELESSPDKTHMFVITDGHPVFTNTVGLEYSTDTLLKFVRKNVLDARSHKIGVTGVLIGQAIPSEQMTYMFGPQKYWRSMPEDFGDDLVELVAQVFVEYLRNR